MNTVQEMIDFAEHYTVTTKKSIVYGVNLKNCPFHVLIDALEPDEDILFCLGTSAEEAVAFTQRRMLVTERPWGLLIKKYKIHSVDYDTINIVSYEGAKIIIKTLRDKDYYLANVYQEQISRAAHIIADLINAYKYGDDSQDTDIHPDFSAAEELKKFKELLDMGAITQEEYDAKKKQLLGL